MEEGGDLAAIFRRLIRRSGPISVAQFMGESNARYYAGKDPLGARGDFVTAPEISQMFGELIGLWLADIWTRSGKPDPVAYVELGPGRGTLARDALRSAAKFGLVPQVHLVEGSPALRNIQAQAVPGCVHHNDLDQLPGDRPLLVVGNEFFDALPVRQLVKTADGWRARMVGLDRDDKFQFIAGSQPMGAAVPEQWRDAAEQSLIETCPGAAAQMQDIAQRLARQGGAALFFDYGHLTPRMGSTLQAVRNHEKVDPLGHPGLADLTAHVDFAALAKIAQEGGARSVQATTQGNWLRAMGIEARSEALARSAPDRREEIDTARARLTSPDEMGSLFKVLAVTGGGWAPGAGFESG